jgi:phosphoglycolate phosphatase
MADIVPGGDPQANAKIFHWHHPTVMFDHTRLLPGVETALEQLHRAGIGLAVCSNKPVAITKKLVSALGIGSYIKLDAVFGPEDSGKPKPDPGMVHCALSRLGIDKANALYVGDMPVDVATARNAGVTVWVLPTGSSGLVSLQAARPDRILSTMAELAPAILLAQ